MCLGLQENMYMIDPKHMMLAYVCLLYLWRLFVFIYDLFACTLDIISYYINYYLMINLTYKPYTNFVGFN